MATWTNKSANAAVKKDMASVQDAVRKGYMTRVAADWQVTHCHILTVSMRTGLVMFID